MSQLIDISRLEQAESLIEELDRENGRLTSWIRILTIMLIVISVGSVVAFLLMAL